VRTDRNKNDYRKSTAGARRVYQEGCWRASPSRDTGHLGDATLRYDNDAKYWLTATMRIARATVRLSRLDSAGNSVGPATGFLVSEPAGTFLYTCWHVVTGMDPRNPDPMSWVRYKDRAAEPRVSDLRVHYRNCEAVQGGVLTHAISKSMTLPLYDQGSSIFRPRWIQIAGETEHADLNRVGIRVPLHLDLVRLPFPLKDDFERDTITIPEAWITPDIPLPGEKISIVGYPFGFSLLGELTTEPLHLTRFVASRSSTPKDPFAVIVDGGAFPGMSGAPVFFVAGGRVVVIGVYARVVFTDAHHTAASGEQHDPLAALGIAHLLSFVQRGAFPDRAVARP
jgi:hypothetical protein